MPNALTIPLPHSMPAQATKPAPKPTVTETDPHRMQCMEVWGSNQAVDNGVVMAGLDAWVYSRPWHDENFGGDVHYVSSCATGRVTRLLLADVSGHGETVAETATVLRQLMRRYVNHVEQRTFVRAMNREFAGISDHRFATTVAASFFAPRKQLIISNAGHLPPLLYRKRTGKWQFIEQDDVESNNTNGDAISNVPLGILDGSDYDESRVTLNVGDLVMLYTDALTESHNTNGSMLGLDGFKSIVESIDVADPAQFVTELRERIASLNSANLDGDDVTIMLFRPNGLGAKDNFFQRAWAGARIIGAAVAKIFGSKTPVPWPEMTLENILGTPFANAWRKVFKSKHHPKTPI